MISPLVLVFCLAAAVAVVAVWSVVAFLAVRVAAELWREYR